MRLTLLGLMATLSAMASAQVLNTTFTDPIASSFTGTGTGISSDIATASGGSIAPFPNTTAPLTDRTTDLTEPTDISTVVSAEPTDASTDIVGPGLTYAPNVSSTAAPTAPTGPTATSEPIVIGIEIVIIIEVIFACKTDGNSTVTEISTSTSTQNRPIYNVPKRGYPCYVCVLPMPSAIPTSPSILPMPAIDSPVYVPEPGCFMTATTTSICHHTIPASGPAPPHPTYPVYRVGGGHGGEGGHKVEAPPPVIRTCATCAETTLASCPPYMPMPTGGGEATPVPLPSPIDSSPSYAPHPAQPTDGGKDGDEDCGYEGCKGGKDNDASELPAEDTPVSLPSPIIEIPIDEGLVPSVTKGHPGYPAVTGSLPAVSGGPVYTGGGVGREVGNEAVFAAGVVGMIGLGVGFMM